MRNTYALNAKPEALSLCVSVAIIRISSLVYRIAWLRLPQSPSAPSPYIALRG